jgi:hypothetical protein
MYDCGVNFPLYAVLCKSYLSQMPNAIWRRGGYISNVMQTHKRQISNKTMPLTSQSRLLGGIRPRLEPVVLRKPPQNHTENDDEHHAKENDNSPDD